LINAVRCPTRRVQLRLALQLDEAHCRPGRGLCDRFRIPLVVLLRFEVGLDVLRRHEPDLMALLPQDVAKVVSAAARLHRHRASRQFGAQPDNAVSRESPPKDDTARLVETRDATAVLTEIDTQHGHRSLLSPDHVRLAPTPKEGRAIP
jgi:hypothetical protein